MIKGILLDIDNTLYNYACAHNSALCALEAFAKENLENIDIVRLYNTARHIIHDEFSQTVFVHSRILYFQKLLELAKINDILLAKTLYDIYWNAFLENMKLYPSVLDFFKSVQGKPICLITDFTAYIQYRKIEKLQINSYADFLVTSEETGVEKPHPKIFQAALKKLNMEPNNVCVIGDSYEKDIQGALNLGIKAYWLTNEKSQTKGVVTFQSFDELAELLA